MRIPSFIKALIGCTDTESSRYSLGGVKAEHRDGVSILTATDGRQLVSVSYADTPRGDDPDTEVLDVVLDGKSLSKAFGVANKRGKDTSVSAAAGTTGKMIVEGGGGSAFVDTTEGRFPRWRDCFGSDLDARGGCSVAVCPELLTQVLAVYKAANVSSVGVWVKDGNSAIGFAGRAPSGEEIRAILMPKEMDGKDDRRTAFPGGIELPPMQGVVIDDQPAVEETTAACA